MAQTKRKPTLNDLRAAGLISGEDLDRMEKLAVRLIQIQDESKALEEERGYSDQHTGKRVPGLADELEALIILNDIGDTGFRIENYSAIIMPGSRSWIDENLLLHEGVDPDVIVRCRRTSTWTSMQMRKD